MSSLNLYELKYNYELQSFESFKSSVEVTNFDEYSGVATIESGLVYINEVIIESKTYCRMYTFNNDDKNAFNKLVDELKDYNKSEIQKSTDIIKMLDNMN